MKFLFDLGGVFFDWDPKHFFKDIFETTEEMNFFLTKVCNDDWNSFQDAGRSFEEAERIISNEFPQYTKQIKMYYLNHRKMIKGTYKNSIEILKKLKKNSYECYVLSNWSSETFKGMMEEYKFLKLFEGIIISGNEKIIKPDPEIYKIAIKRFKLEPKNSLFIDDKLINISAAEKLGFKTLHLTDPKTIYENIEKCLSK
tara:strand:- start:528 stop:1124 length:597 start_codon:yes stop_codon:yes gene_type:complete